MYNFRVLWKYITILNISSWIEYLCDVWSRFIEILNWKILHVAERMNLGQWKVVKLSTANYQNKSRFHVIFGQFVVCYNQFLNNAAHQV